MTDPREVRSARENALAAALGALAIALVGGAAAWTLVLAFDRGRQAVEGSSRRSDADGTRALFLVLEETGHRPQRSTRPLPRAGTLLVLVEPLPSGADVDEALAHWVQEGGAVLFAPRRPREPEASPQRTVSFAERPRETLPLERRFGLELVRGAASAGPVAEGLSGLPALAADRAEMHWSRPPPRSRVLLGTADSPVLVEVPIGSGKVWALSDPRWLENHGLPHGDRLALVLRLMLEPGRPIVFDEYRHGLQEQPGLAYVLARYGLLPTAFAALAFLGLLAWRTTPAEAPAPPPGDPAPAMRDSLVEARAALYARAMRGREALALLDRDLRHAASQALGSAAPLPWAELQRRVADRRPAALPSVRAMASELARRRSGPPPRLEDLVPLARRAAHLVQELR